MRTATFCALTISLLLVACSRYAINVNEKTVYNPLQVFTDFKVADLALQRCIDQTIKEEKIRSAKGLTHLLCPQKSIRSLAGLEIFEGLTVLGLEENPLEDVDALRSLTQLQQLNLKNTGLHSLTLSGEGSALSYLNLQGNPEFACTGLAMIHIKEGGQLLEPKHCLQ